MPAVVHTGSCLCGGVQFRIDAELAPIQICHCSQCRKAQGTPFATNLPVNEAAFRLLQGKNLLKSFESSPGKQRVFCSHCGSPIYSQKDTVPGVLRVRAGLLDEPVAAALAVHFHTASRCSWWEIRDELPQFEGAYRTEASS